MKRRKDNCMPQNQVCLFFYVDGQFLIHGCDLADAENYGDFLICPDSHFEIWENHYALQYHVDFDFYPRGRVAYHKSSQTFQILYDRCIGSEIQHFAETHYSGTVSLGYDKHYQCHSCNQNYVI